MHNFKVAIIMQKASTNSLPWALSSFFVEIGKIIKRYNHQGLVSL